MKVTLDLTRLLEEGKIDRAEFDHYTQWFDRLGPTPLAFLLGGLMLAFGLGLWFFNRRPEAVAR